MCPPAHFLVETLVVRASFYSRKGKPSSLSWDALCAVDAAGFLWLSASSWERGAGAAWWQGTAGGHSLCSLGSH